MRRTTTARWEEGGCNKNDNVPRRERVGQEALILAVSFCVRPSPDCAASYKARLFLNICPSLSFKYPPFSVPASVPPNRPPSDPRCTRHESSILCAGRIRPQCSRFVYPGVCRRLTRHRMQWVQRGTYTILPLHYLLSPSHGSLQLCSRSFGNVTFVGGTRADPILFQTSFG